MIVPQPRPELEGIAQALERAFPPPQRDHEAEREMALLRRLEKMASGK